MKLYCNYNVKHEPKTGKEKEKEAIFVAVHCFAVITKFLKFN